MHRLDANFVQNKRKNLSGIPVRGVPVGKIVKKQQKKHTSHFHSRTDRCLRFVRVFFRKYFIFDPVKRFGRRLVVVFFYFFILSLL